jgi:hypothetical protein
MTLCSAGIQLYAVWRIRDAIRWSALWPMLAAGAFMVPVGVWLLLHVDAALYRVGLGVFLSAYGLFAVFRRNDIVVSGSAWRDAGAGALGGLAGGLAGLSGSFVTIWCSMRGWGKDAQRAVYQPFILVMQVWTLVWLRWLASSHAPLFEGLRFVPFALLAGIAGFAIYERLTHAGLSRGEQPPIFPGSVCKGAVVPTNPQCRRVSGVADTACMFASASDRPEVDGATLDCGDWVITHRQGSDEISAVRLQYRKRQGRSFAVRSKTNRER